MNLNESSAVMWKTRFIFVSHTTLFSNFVFYFVF